ncbi:MAG: hypothetical protein ACTHL3_01110 [Candidatus Nitrosocosmicus sp.]
MLLTMQEQTANVVDRFSDRIISLNVFERGSHACSSMSSSITIKLNVLIVALVKIEKNGTISNRIQILN